MLMIHAAPLLACLKGYAPVQADSTPRHKSGATAFSSTRLFMQLNTPIVYATQLL